MLNVITMPLWIYGTVEAGAQSVMANMIIELAVNPMSIRVVFSVPVWVCGTVKQWKRGPAV